MCGTEEHFSETVTLVAWAREVCGSNTDQDTDYLD